MKHPFFPLFASPHFRMRGLKLLLVLCQTFLNVLVADTPNVVYILSDTHRWGAMSFTQTPAVQTPHLETLAQQGVSFSRCYVNLPICTPYRALLMTGRWPYQQGLIANHMSLAERVDLPEGDQTHGTLSGVFKHAGYTTAHIGKWHLGGRDARPFGFDTSIVWGGTNNHRRSVYSIDGAPNVVWRGESNATAMTTQTLDWIDKVHGGGKPFFVVLSLNPPHGPFGDALEEKKALYPDEATLPFHPLDDIRSWENHRGYHALISNVDDQVGRIAAELDRLGISENTLLIYTSDHGGMSGVGGVGYGQKRHPNDESTRVPFIASWPGRIPAGIERQTLFSTIDVFPTLAGIVGLHKQLKTANTPEASASLAYLNSLPGVDLSGALLNQNGGPEPRSVFLMHPSNMNNNSQHEPVWRAIVTRDYTYAVTGDAEYALWENERNYQSENLVKSPETLAIRKQLWNELNAWMEVAETPFVDNWFARAAPDEISSWNEEQGLGKDNRNRKQGKDAVFNMNGSKP